MITTDVPAQVDADGRNLADALEDFPLDLVPVADIPPMTAADVDAEVAALRLAVVEGRLGDAEGNVRRILGDVLRDRDDARAAAAVAVADVERLTETETSLRAQVDAARVDLSTSRERHREDLETVGRMLAEEADSRSYCSEFEDVIGKIARRLHRGDAFEDAASRTRDYVVDVPVVAVVSVTVTCRDEDEALEYARSSWRDYLDRDSLDWSADDSRSWDVTEA